jgi:hypothetical protein
VKYRITIGCNAISHTNFFCNINKNSSEASTPTSEDDAFGTKLTKSHRFGSSGLNLIFEGLLLGQAFMYLQRVPAATPANQVSGFPIHSLMWKEYSSCFCRKSKVNKASPQKLTRTNSVDTRVAMQAEARRWRWCASHQPKVPAPVRHAVALHWPTKSGVLM